MSISQYCCNNSMNTNNIHDNDQQYPLYIDWKLLNGCNFSCPYCHIENVNTAEEYNKVSLLDTAYNILSQPRSAYTFKFTGGEPTLHPYFYDLLVYLYKQPLNIKTIIDTNGSRNLFYYKRLLQLSSPHCLQLNISIHLKYANQKHIFDIVNIVKEYSQQCYINLFFYPGSDLRLAQKLYTSLLELCNKFQVLCRIVFFNPSSLYTKSILKYSEEEKNWAISANTSLKTAYFKQENIFNNDFWPISTYYKDDTIKYNDKNLLIDHKSKETPNFIKSSETFCCPGTTLFTVDTQGNITPHVCSVIQNSINRGINISYENLKQGIVQCKEKNCLCPSGSLLPKFQHQQDAFRYMETFHTYLLAGAVRHIVLAPSHMPDENKNRVAAHWISVSYKNKTLLQTPPPSLPTLKKSGNQTSWNTGFPPILPQISLSELGKRIDDITFFYNCLEDNQSRDVLIRALKTWESGNAEWICDSPYPPLVHPSQGHIEESESTPGYTLSPTLLRLTPEEVHTEIQLTKWKNKICYYKPMLQIALPTPQHLFETILLIRHIESAYKIYLGQHGQTLYNNIVWLYGVPKVLPPLRSVASLKNADSPSLSIIIALTDNGDSLPRCVASLLFQDGVNLEIILVNNASNDNSPQIANEYQKRFPTIFKIVHFAKRQTQAKVYNTGLDIATGKSVLFLNPENILLPGVASMALQYIAEQNYSIVSFKRASKDGSEEFYTLEQEQAVLVGFDALKALITRNAKFSDDILSGCFYDHIFLRQCGANFENINIVSSLFFTLHICAFSAPVLFTDKVGLLTYSLIGHQKTKENFSLINFIESLTLEKLFFDAHEPEHQALLSKICTQEIYRLFKKYFFSEEHKIKDDSSIFFPWININVDKSIIDTFTELLVEDVNKIIIQKDQPCLSNNTCFNIPTFNQIEKIIPYDFAIPQISIILCVFSLKQAYWENLIHDILSRMVSSYELIIVASSCDEEAQVLMEHYATMYPALHVYWTQEQATLCECRNTGLEKARGDWVLFLKDSDILEKDFCYTLSNQPFLDGITDYDISIFGTLTYDKDGNLVRSFSPPQGHNESARIMLRLLMSLQSLPSLCSFIFRKSLLEKYHLIFTNSIISESIFLLRTLSLCTRVFVTSAFLCGSKEDVLSLPYRKTNTHTDDLDILDDLVSVAQCISAFENINLPENILITLYTLTFSHLESYFDNAASPSSVADLVEHLSKFKNRYNALHFMVCVALLSYTQKYIAKTIDHVSFKTSNLWRQSISPSPLVTVVVIIEQGGQETKLVSCLDALAQQYILDLEVLVLDPFSSSSIAEICINRTNTDGRFKLLTGSQGQKELPDKIHGRYLLVLYQQQILSPDFLFHALSVMEHDSTIDLSVHTICLSEGFEIETLPNNTVLSGKEIFLYQIEKLFEQQYLYSFIAKCSFLKEKKYFLNLLQLCTQQQGEAINALHLLYYAQKVFYMNDSTSIRLPISDFTKIDNKKNSNISGNALSIFRQICPLIQTTNDSLANALADKAFIYFQSALGLWASRLTSEALEPENLLNTDITDYFHSTPDVAIRLLEDYAHLYAAKTHYCPSIPSEEYHPTFALRVPAKALLPLSPQASTQKPVRISVIVPAFNVAPFIGVCLDSILSQMPDGLEIILVEDCSTEDNTLAVCLEYAQRFPQIRLFRTPTNSGLGVVRNLALKQAIGEYITFVDSDDWLEAGFLLKALHLMDNDPACELTIFSSRRWMDIVKNDFWPMQKSDHVLTGKECLEAYLTGTMNHWTAWGILYRSNFIKSFSFGTLLYEDVLWAFTCFSKATRVRLSSIIAYNYRYDSQSSIMRPKVKGLLYFISSLHVIEIGTHFLESDLRLYAIFCRHFFFENKYQKTDILCYIVAMKALGRSSPLTHDICRRFLASPYFSAAILADYLSLSPCRLLGKKIKIDITVYKIVTGNSGSINTVSLQDVVSEKFLRHKDSLLYKHPDKVDKLFTIDSSFVPEFYKEGFVLRCSNPGMENHYISKDSGNRYVIAVGIQKAFRFHLASATLKSTTAFVDTSLSSQKISSPKISSISIPKKKTTTALIDQNIQTVPESDIRRIDWDTLVSPEIWKENPLKAVEISLRRSGIFDTRWYLEKYPDVAQANMDPIYHYVHHGAREGRCPVSWFLHQSMTPLKDSINPLYDYIRTLVEDKKSVAKRIKSKNDYQEFQEVIPSRPKVSVLVPIYNNIQYLPKCIDSILTQSLKNLEVLCINDGSTDPGVIPLLEKYCRLDNRIRLISKANTGYGHSMNVGIDHAVGEYIGIVESDDYIRPDMFDRMYNVARCLSLPMVICDFIRFKGKAEEGETEICRMMDDSYYEKEILIRENIQAINSKGWIAIWTGLYDCNFLRKNNIRFNETPGASYQDTGFWFQTFCFAKKVYFIREPFYYYRFDNPNSSINDKSKVFTVCEEYDFVKKFFDRNPQLHDDFLPMYYYKKCNGYMWNYDRLEKRFKEPFLKKYSEEFKKDIENGQFIGSMVHEERLNALMHLVKDPNGFLQLKEHG